MIEVIVIGHGNFANGIKSNAELIIGKLNHLHAIDFTFDLSPDMIGQRINCIIEENQQSTGYLIFTDLLNGTPFNISATFAAQNPKVKLVYGVNPAMILETCMRMNIVDDVHELAKNAVEIGKNQIGLFEYSVNTDEDDDL